MHAERLRILYMAMLKCRCFQAAMGAIGKGQRSSSVHEAVIAGAAVHLKQDDLVAPSGSNCLARFVQGTPPEHLFSEFKAIGKLQAPQQGQIPDRTVPVNAELTVAAGMALACKELHQTVITLIIHGQPRASESWRDAVKFASSRQLPVVFVLVTQAGQGQKDESERRIRAQEFLPCITVDGNDVVAVYRVAEESTRRARQGLGPSLIECRVGAGPDPIIFMENYLKQRSLWQESWKKDFIGSVTRELNAALMKSFGKSAARRAITRTPLI